MSLLLKFTHTHTHTWFPSNNTPTCCNGWANIIYNRLKCHLFYVFNHFNLCIFIIQVCQKEVISNNLSHVCITFDNMSLVILELLIAFIIVAKFLHSEPILMSCMKIQWRDSCTSSLLKLKFVIWNNKNPNIEKATVALAKD